MDRKKLMLLGGLRYLIPVIETAHNHGYYVITADNVPDNIAHRFSDEYCNVSVLDKEAVLLKAKELKIDGIMSFACDPGVVAASYVQNELLLPSFGPYESICILQNKNRFRSFLAENNFNVPFVKSYNDINIALQESKQLTFPVIVKPVDSAGSKGVTKVEKLSDLGTALILAFNNSYTHNIIIEEFLPQEGCSSDSDCFSEDGRLTCINFNSQHFDKQAANPFTPAAYSWPSTFTKEQKEYLASELQRLITLLGMKTAIYNVETRISKGGKPFIMEVSPRGGGNRLSELVKLITGVDLIATITRYCVGDKIEPFNETASKENIAEIVLHSDRDGIFNSIEIKEEVEEFILQKDIWVKRGDYINSFKGANNSLGTLIMEFPDKDTMESTLRDQKKWLKITIS